MQIEESFRDMKSTKFGMGFGHNHTYKIKRMSLLVMMTTLAEMVFVLLGKVVEQAGLSYRFQSNSIRHRRILSFSYLGKRAISVDLKITAKQWREGIIQCTKTLREESSIFT